MTMIEDILKGKTQSKRLLVLLIDPEKQDLLQGILPHLSLPDIIFVGGSTAQQCDACVTLLREHTPKPIVLFPGSIAQFTPKADALLFLTLLNARRPEILIDPHVRVARQVQESAVESIPMGYILIDGERRSSVELATNCKPLPQENVEDIVSTAIAGQLLGKSLIYLEAGSGANTPVSPDIIRAVRNQIHIPLIVGGGITTPEAMLAAYDAGADMVVIGNHFEQHPDEIATFVQIKQSRYPSPIVNNQSPIANSQIPHPLSPSSDDIRYMRLALAEAQKAYAMGEVPVGCVIVADGQIVGRGHNLTETLADVTAHAEMQAITAATNTLGGKYLSQCTLYVTVEPCVMCAGAIGWSQIKRVVYGASDEKRGFTVFSPKAIHPKCLVLSGVLEPECRELMQSFFVKKRTK